MRISSMRYIVEVSKYKSISKAAREMFINQQQLSKIIQQTESDLGKTIFKRTNKGISLTPEGEMIVEKFKMIIGLYDSLDDQPIIQPTVKGEVCILTEANIWSGYGRIIRDFANAYPNVNVSLHNMASKNIVAYLKEHSGVGLFFTTRQAAEHFEIADELEISPTTRANIAVFACYDSPYIKKYKTISLSTLSKLPLINYKPYSDQPTIMELIFAQAGLKPNIKYEVSERHVFNDLVKKSGSLFFGLRKPQYVAEDSFGEIRLRDNIECMSGIIQRKNCTNAADKLFADFYINYCKSNY